MKRTLTQRQCKLLEQQLGDLVDRLAAASDRVAKTKGFPGDSAVRVTCPACSGRRAWMRPATCVVCGGTRWLDGAALLRIARQVEGRPGSTIPAVTTGWRWRVWTVVAAVLAAVYCLLPPRRGVARNWRFFYWHLVASAWAVMRVGARGTNG